MPESSGCTHFDYQMRQWLSMLLSKGHSYRCIGQILNMNHTSISREISRNSIIINNGTWYDPHEAQKKANVRAHEKRGCKIARDKWLSGFVESKLKSTWSPDAIAGYLGTNEKGIYVSHETIYKYIYREKREWISYLALGHKKRRRRTGKYGNRKKVLIPGRILIDKRPKGVSARKVFGHFEADTFISRSSKAAVLIAIERKTRKIRLKKLSSKSAVCVKESMVEVLYVNRNIVKTITYDNGTENVKHQEINDVLQCKSFFCNPYRSWERGSVEQAIGLVRRFIPKGSDLSLLTNIEIKKIERTINSRPRKLLNYKTPNQVFSEEWCTKG